MYFFFRFVLLFGGVGKLRGFVMAARHLYTYWHMQQIVHFRAEWI